MDGLLTITKAPFCNVTLYDNANETEDDSEEEDEETSEEEEDKMGRKKKKRWKKQQQKRHFNNRKKKCNHASRTEKCKKKVIYAGKNKPLSNRAFGGGFNVDDTIICSNIWECQIVALSPSSSFTTITEQKKSVAVAPKKHILQKRKMVPLLTSKNKLMASTPSLLNSSRNSEESSAMNVAAATASSSSGIKRKRNPPAQPTKQHYFLHEEEEEKGVCPDFQHAYQIHKYDNNSGSDDGDYDDGQSISAKRLRGGAILADEMGLGKTLMTIAVIFGLSRQDKQK
eukprot:5648729-Ditylum_brightwellii.AAC.1